MWVELQGIDGTKVTYNKKTGEIIDHAEDGMDLFESTIKDMFKAADSDGKGFITKETFLEMLQDKAAELSYDQINELVDKLPDGNISYAQFHGVGKESVLKIYQAKDQTDSEWMFLNSPSVGGFYLNKITGETKRDIGVSNMQEAAFFENAYSQINDLTLELEQERAKNRELENQIAQMNEHLEETVAQLDETGRHLDNTNLELSAREEEIEQLRTLITEKDKSIAKLSTKSDEVTSLEGKLDKTNQELTEARQVITDKDGRIKDLEKTIQDLSVTVDAITDELKNAHGVIDARDSNITSLQYNLTNEQGRVKELKHKMPSLEIKLTSIVDDLTTTKRLLEERTTQLRQTKKQLKQLKKLTSENDKKMETLEQAKEKLVVTENENRTLKSFLTSKTAMIERRKKELQELKDKMSEMETRDNRRALILADVLEKTARSYQQQLKVTDPISISDNRPISAPSIPLEDLIEYQQDRLSESFSLPAAKLTPAHKTLQKSPPKKTSPTKNKIKSRVVTKLPPIKPQQRDFSFTTNMEMRRNYKKTDNAIATSKRVMEKGECDCEICSLNKEQTDKEMPPYLSSMVAQSNNGLEQIKNEVDRRERDLAKQLKVGQRVLVQIKKSKFDLEPQKLTGIVKYIGNVDSEFIDDRIYVGVKLDEPVGNTDGIYKGKKYFDCPANHGRMLRVTSVLAVMPNKGIIYRPLQLSGQSNNTTHTSIRTMS
jgi:peptidoglycan hydrolase CwlO-like protein